MLDIRIGDFLPTVAVVQTLLNARLEMSTPITVDGAFGISTENAVKNFQRKTNCSDIDGIVGTATWNRLSQGMGFTVKDVIDVTDPDLAYDEVITRKYNPNPIIIGGMSNAVEHVINLIVNSTPNGSLLLIRFDGHGNAGVQGVGIGTTDIVLTAIYGKNKPSNMKDIDERNTELFRNTIIFSTISVKNLKFLARLRPCFSPYGSIEFHGCEVAKYEKGRSFMKEVSKITGVPASGSLYTQQVGQIRRFIGQTYTGCPNGLSLKEWSAALPSINMSFL
jgi:peptidoglycan hydrolase-like protein with peptidoglycan-binding domain